MSKKGQRKNETEPLSTVYLTITILLVIVLSTLIETVILGFQISISGLGLIIVGLIVVLWWLRTR